MPPLLKFLRLSGSSTEKDLEIIDKGVQCAKSNQIDVIIISDTEEIKKLISESTRIDQSIYVCLPFEGKIFEKLKEKGYRIIGPQCVISCLLLEMPVPKRTYPVCNIAMLDTVICCSSMKKVERSQIQQLVLMMGGDVTGDFTLGVTHLVAKEVGSKKYEVACSNKVPTVFPSWIHSAWENSKYDHFVATEKNVIKEHLIPIFKGCTICVTGIDATKREAIKTLVNKNGGEYSGELNMKTCTHLLVEHPCGQKYAHARQWKLHCVSPTWLYDCLKKKHWIDEKLYTVEPDSNTTANNTILQQSNIQNTILGSNNSRMSSIPAEIAAKSKDNNKTGKKIESGNANKNIDLKLKVILPQSINITDFKLGESNSYLEECKIYVCNHPGPIYDICKKSINNGGGIRLNVLSDSITHIVAWDQIQPDVSRFLNGIKENDGMFPHVISPMWLIDSCKNGNLMLEEDYSLIEGYGKDENEIEDDVVFAKPKIPVAKSTVRSSLQMQFEDDVADESTLLNQYLTVNHESTRISQLEIPDEKKGKPDLDEVTQQDDDTTLILDDESTNILERKKFVIRRCEPDQVSQITSLIEEYGGDVVDSNKECDYIIVPVSHNKDISIDPKEVTLCWLEQSIEQQKLKDPKSNFLYQPIFLPDNARPLQNCVITISQYTGLERQHLFHLAELLGGIGQEYFVRNDTATMKASTHLILSKPEGSKYDASVKWNIPCVDKEWLFRCAKTKRRLPEEAFTMFSKKEECVKENEEVVTNVEETNAHAWEKKPEIPVVADKSVIACPLNDLTDHISIDFSTRGASLMDDVANKDTPEIAEKDIATCVIPEIGEDISTPFMPEVAEEDVSISLMHTTAKSDSPNISDKEEKSLPEETLQANNEVTKPATAAMDFSVFNAFIANEKRASLGDTVKSGIDKENVNNSPILPSSFPHDFNKSRFSFDFTDALDGWQSPMISSQDSRRKSRRSRASLPFDVQFTEALQKAVDKHCGVVEEINDYSDMFTKNKKPAGAPILQDVVVVVSKKLCHSQTELHNFTTILGGDIRFMYDNSCTHFIHQGKVNDTSKDYVEAKRNKKYLVSPHWLQACVEANMKVNEDKYPVTYNPRMSIEVTSDRPSRSKTQVKANTGSSSTDDTDIDLNNKGKNDSAKPSSPKEKVDFQKKMEEIMNAAKAPRNERRSRKLTSNTSANKSDNCNRKMRNRTSSQKNDSGQSSSSDPQVAKISGVDCINEQSQGGFITYDDPTGRLERERILEHLKRASPSQDIESLYYPVEKLGCAVKDTDTESLRKKGNEDLEESIIEAEDDDGNVHKNVVQNEPKKSLSPYKPQISLPITNASAQPEVIDLLYDKEAEDELKKIENASKYKFLFSGMNAQEKIDYGATIEELGGVLFDVQYFNMQSTHLVVKAPSKNEKYLASLASGRWALHKSYLDASREANDFVDELDHEWGSQSSANELASAARRWRIELADKRLSDHTAGAFLGWVVLLCIEPSKQAGFKRILEAGGAKLLSLRPPFENIQSATHAFIGDRKQLVKTKVDLHLLHDAGIWILKPEYIADYLIIHPKPPTFDYVLEEVNTFDDELSESTTSQRKRKASEVPKVKQVEKRVKRR